MSQTRAYSVFLSLFPISANIFRLLSRSEVSPVTRTFVSSKAHHVEGFTQTRLGIASRDCLRESRVRNRERPVNSGSNRQIFDYILTFFNFTVSDSLGQLVVLPRRALNPFLPKPSNKKGNSADLEHLPPAKVLGRAENVSFRLSPILLLFCVAYLIFMLTNLVSP